MSIKTGKVENPGERLYIGIISMHGASFGGAEFWAFIVDSYASS
jgi:hypothetical protein